MITCNLYKLTCIRSRDKGWTVPKVIISMYRTLWSRVIHVLVMAAVPI